MIGVTVLMFYLLMMRPDQQKRKAMEQLIANVKKNDHVETIGGISGAVDPRPNRAPNRCPRSLIDFSALGCVVPAVFASKPNLSTRRLVADAPGL